MQFTDSSLLLLKPDGVASPAVNVALTKLLVEHSLTVAGTEKLMLSTKDVLSIWPVFRNDDHAFTRAMYEKYMTSGPSVLFYVHGKDALRSSLLVKKAIRREFEVCAFQNAIHSPIDTQEYLSNLEYFRTGAISDRTYQASAWTSSGRYGLAAEVPLSEIERIAGKIWNCRSSGGWLSIAPDVIDVYADKFYAELIPGDPNSIDFGISAICEFVPTLTYEQAARIYICAEVSGRATIAYGTRIEMEHLRARFAEVNMALKVNSDLA